MDFLARKNPHPRDEHIQFDEPTHTYTIDGDSSFTSVTTWNHSHFEEFDADKVIAGISRLIGQMQNVGKHQRKAGWEKNRVTLRGTKCTTLNAIIIIPVSNDSVEYSQFIKYQEEHAKNLFHTERVDLWDH